MKNQNPLNIIYISEIGLKRYLIPKGLADFNIKAITAESYEKIKSQLKNKKPDLLLLEFEFMPDDINSMIRKITIDIPGIKLLMIGNFNSVEIAKSLLQSGAKGYYDQHCPDGTEGFVTAIRSVYNGETVIEASPYTRS